MDRSTALRILGLSEIQVPEAPLVQGAYWRLRAHLERRAREAESPAAARERQAELAGLEVAYQVASGRPEAAAEPEVAEGQGRPRWLIAWAALATAVALGLAVLLWAALSQPPVGAAGAGGGGGAAGAGASGGQLAVGGAPNGEEAGAPAAALAAAGGEGPAGEEGSAAPGGGPGPGEAMAHGASPSANAGPGSAGAAPPGDPAVLVAKANLPDSRLRISRSGDGAAVFEGAADDAEHSLPAGRYVLRVSNPECSDTWESEVALAPGERRRVEPRNCEKNGWLVVRSNVSGDRVAIDARPVGGSGPTRHPVSVGEHRVLVQKEGYVTWEGVTRVDPAEEVTLRAQLFEAAEQAPASPAEPEAEDGDLAESRKRLSGAWREQTERWVLGRYDGDRSGRIDTPAEVRAIECRDLLDIEGTFDRAELGVSLTRFFGFDGSTWVDGALGFDRKVRDLAYARMKECGLQ